MSKEIESTDLILNPFWSLVIVCSIFIEAAGIEPVPFTSSMSIPITIDQSQLILIWTLSYSFRGGLPGGDGVYETKASYRILNTFRTFFSMF